jgi:hypothetical protein
MDLLEKLSCRFIGKHGVEVELGLRKDAVKIHGLLFHSCLVPFLRLHLLHHRPRHERSHRSE